MFMILVGVPLVFAPVTAAQFVDVKLLVLVGGCALVASSRPFVDGRTARAAVALSAAMAVATAGGLDPWWSLLGPEDQGTGLVLLVASAFLVAAGSGTGEDLRSRIPTWLFGTGVAVCAVAVAGRFLPLGGPTWSLGELSSTLGHRVFVGGFAAAAAIAATAIERRIRTDVGLLIIGSGLAVTAVRSAWVGVVLGLGLVLWRAADRGRILRVVTPMLLAVGAWTAVDATLPEREIAFSAAPRFADLDEGSAQERPRVYSAYARAWREDLLLGSGPGTGWNGYLRHGTAAEVRVAGRGYSDAHNIILELGATTGLLGVASFLALAGVVLAGVRRPAPERTWALGIAVAIGVTHMLQPLNLVLTPLAFLSAGLAIDTDRKRAQLRVGRSVIVLFSLAFVLAGVRFGASAFQRYGASYGSADAFAWSLRLEPRRLQAGLQFAELRAFDHRTGDTSAAADARRLAATVVRHHPWSPRVRPAAANVLLVMDDVRRARALIDEHLEVFPRDAEGLAAAAQLSLRTGDRREAEGLARKSLRLDPDNAAARAALAEATRLRS